MFNGMIHVGDEAIPEGIPETLDVDATYRVQLSAPIEIAPGVVLSPGQRQEMKGSLVDEHRESIYGAVKAESSGSIPA